MFGHGNGSCRFVCAELIVDFPTRDAIAYRVSIAVRSEGQGRRLYEVGLVF